MEKLAEEKLHLAEAIELTKHRHFITCTKADTDLFPYEFSYRESKTKRPSHPNTDL